MDGGSISRSPMASNAPDRNQQVQLENSYHLGRPSLLALAIVGFGASSFSPHAQAARHCVTTVTGMTFNQESQPVSASQVECWDDGIVDMGWGGWGGGGGNSNNGDWDRGPGAGSGGSITTPSVEEQRTADKLEKARCAGEVSGNPVVLSTGNKVEPEVDFSSEGAMPLRLSRTYNSFWSGRGLFGRFWLSNFDYSITVAADGKTIWAQRPDGRRIRFQRDAASGNFVEQKALPIAYIVRNQDGSLTLFNDVNGHETYSAAGRITTRVNEQGIGWTFTYRGDYLDRVTHTSGRFVAFEWANGMAAKVTDPAGNVYRYYYDHNIFGSGAGSGRLTNALLPGSTITYFYEDNRLPGALTGKAFNDTRYSTFTYDAEGRATSTQHSGGVERFQFAYDVKSSKPVIPPPAPLPPGGYVFNEERRMCEYGPNGVQNCHGPRLVDEPMQQFAMAASAPVAQASDPAKAIPVRIDVTETTPLGRKTTYAYQDDRLVSVSGAAGSCPASFKEKAYDENGYERRTTDFAGVVTEYSYDGQGHILRRVEAAGTPVARTWTYEWDMANNRLLSQTLAGQATTRYSYDARGRILSITNKDLTAAGAGREQQVTYGYRLHGNGLVAEMTIDGPLPGTGDRSTLQYSVAGDLIAYTNGSGHSIRFENHNGLGKPGRITTANGAINDYVYDARGRTIKETSTVDGKPFTTTYSYTPAGLVDTVVHPDGSQVHNYYDSALRLLETWSPNKRGGYSRRAFGYNNASQVTFEQVMETAYPVTTQVTGAIDRVTHDTNWNWYVEGWACSMGMDGSIDVHVYANDAAGGSSFLGGNTANLVSEPQVATSCKAGGSNYRYHIGLPADLRLQHGGKTITVYGNAVDGGQNRSLGGSGASVVPAPMVVGNIDEVSHDSNWNYYVRGWACATGVARSIDVHLYAGGAAGAGTFAVSGSANQASEPGVAAACQIGGGAYRFTLPLDAGMRRAHGGKGIFIHGISPAGGPNSLVGPQGGFTVPAMLRGADLINPERGTSLSDEQTWSVTFTVRNTGNTVWNPGSTAMVLNTGEQIALGHRVLPGELAQFNWSYEATAEALTRTHVRYFQMMDAGIRFGPNHEYRITVGGKGSGPNCSGVNCYEEE
ncbi:type IV secretion protein Rhs [Stenotrophomonas maltophilia]|nr:type IV secretion protein Rhs [Stenotrophomonas maltophilia]MBA0268236.1 type IV secretion protein Rhs [Stenotrophomonas maltophilia]MBA0333114.1 type IV secretion protein Rhs [Stenotrophomonas maltophilia]